MGSNSTFFKLILGLKVFFSQNSKSVSLCVQSYPLNKEIESLQATVLGQCDREDSYSSCDTVFLNVAVAQKGNEIVDMQVHQSGSICSSFLPNMYVSPLENLLLPCCSTSF